jgi:hypothetical protein
MGTIWFMNDAERSVPDELINVDNPKGVSWTDEQGVTHVVPWSAIQELEYSKPHRDPQGDVG